MPEEAQRAAGETEPHHTGRGGAGNEPPKPASANGSKTSSPIGLADKLKNKLFGKK